MKRTPVESSNIASVGHDPAEKVLEIEFLGGGVYQYLDVPASIYGAFMLAPSKGRFFAEHVKDHYAWERMPEEAPVGMPAPAVEQQPTDGAEGEERARLREALADEQHAIWAHWMRYLFHCCQPQSDGAVTIPPDKVTRWQRQIATPYLALTEQEKESDRFQADRVIAVLDRHQQETGGA